MNSLNDVLNERFYQLITTKALNYKWLIRLYLFILKNVYRHIATLVLLFGHDRNSK
jgi:hypothetical protein